VTAASAGAFSDCRRDAVMPLLELVGLSGLAVAQPLFEVFGDGADVFVAYGAGRVDVVLFALAVALVVPLVLFALELLAGLVGPGWRRVVHVAAVGLLLAALASQVLKSETDLGWRAVALGAGLLALAGAVAVWRWRPPRLFLRFLAAAALAFLALFLFSSPVTSLVVPSADVAAADVEVGNPAPVVFIVLDELPSASLLGPDDRIHAELFPNLAELAGDATWYRNETTVAPETREAVPALLTGRYPEAEATLPTARKHPDNLFTLLGETYDIHASEAWTRLCPPNLCGDTGVADGASLPRLLDDAREVWGQKASPRRRERQLTVHGDAFQDRQDQVLDFAAQLDDGGDGRPRLDFLHVLLPHEAHEYLPSGQRYGAPLAAEGLFYGGWFDEDVAAAARSRHLLQVAATDRVLGHVLDRLRELDRYDESLIVVTADHGAAFAPGASLRTATEDSYHEIMWTPLVVKAPGQTRGAVDDTPAESVDVVPTVAELLEVELPWPVDGRPIAEGRRADVPRRLLRFGRNALGGDGEFSMVDGEAGFRRLLAEPPASTWTDDFALFRHGPYGDLVGRRVADLEVAAPIEARGRIDGAEVFREVDLEGALVPAYISGELTVEGPEAVVAVAVNGVVGGWSRAYLGNFLPVFEEGYFDRPHTRRWWTMVPPELLREGRNRVELFRIDGEPGSAALRPVPLRD
jgi:hypothetical protein